MMASMKARDTLKLSVLRGMISAFTNELVAKGKKPSDALTDNEAIAVLKRLHKQRTEAAEQFEKGGRKELAEKELAERAIVESYLPAKTSREEIVKVASETMKELGISDSNNAGRLVGAVMKALKGAADGNEVKAVVLELLQSSTL